MINLHGNGSLFTAQRVPSTGPEADPVAKDRAAEPGLAMPHDLVSGFGVMFPAEVSAKVRDQPDGVAQPVGGRHPPLRRIVPQEVQVPVGEHELGVAVGNLSSQKGHGHDAPGDHGVDGDGPLQPVGGAEACPDSRCSTRQPDFSTRKKSSTRQRWRW